MEDATLKRKDLWIFLGAVVLVLVLLLAASFLPKTSIKKAGGQLGAEVLTSPAKTGEEDESSVAESPIQQTAKLEATQSAPTSEAEQTQAPSVSQGLQAQVPELIPADAYLSVQVGQVVYDPFPLLEDNELSIRQKEDMLNVIGVTKTSIWMKSSTCDNQACVHQGIVTLDNMSTRVLQNMIICLPNEVVLSLLTPQEAQLQWEGLYGEAASN